MKVRTRRFDRGRLIFAEGDQSAEAFVVREGRVEIARKVRGSRMTLAVLEPGAIFGEMSLLLSSPRTADALAIEDTECYAVDREEFDRLLGECPRFIQGMMRVMSHHIRTMNERLAGRQSIPEFRDDALSKAAPGIPDA